MPRVSIKPIEPEDEKRFFAEHRGFSIHVTGRGTFKYKPGDNFKVREVNTLREAKKGIDEALDQSKHKSATRERPCVACLIVVDTTKERPFRYGRGRDEDQEPPSLNILHGKFLGYRANTSKIKLESGGKDVAPDRVRGVFPITKMDQASRFLQAKLAEWHAAHELNAASLPVIATSEMSAFHYEQHFGISKGQAWEFIEDNITARLQGLPDPHPIPKERERW